jgi:hypothetical protein
MLLTEMLARWSRSVELSEAECLEWLMPYCCEVLALTSKSGPSLIRHGTKANTRWVYKSNLPFDFEAAIRAMPQPAQPIPAYMPLFAVWWHELGEAKQRARDAYVPPVFLPVLPVKQRHKEAFQKALAFARAREAEGETATRIVELLNAEGLPTATGRKWTLSNLVRALRQNPLPSEPAAPNTSGAPLGSPTQVPTASTDPTPDSA